MSFLQEPDNTPDAPDVEPDVIPEPTSQGTAPLPDKGEAPKVPDVPAGTPMDEVKEMLAGFIAEQKAWRSKVVQEVRQNRIPSAAPGATDTIEDRTKARKAEIESSPYYCCVCGKTSPYLRECVGPRGANHPPVVVVSTKELQGEPDPLSKDAHAEWAAQHTPAPTTEELIAAASA
jgi:hypothetical protein